MPREPECVMPTDESWSTLEIARHLTIKIEHLPAVATLDWCDQAAQCVASGLCGAVAAVLIASVSETGVLTQMEAVGVSTGAEARGTGARSHPETEGLGSVRSELESLRAIPCGPGDHYVWSTRERFGSNWKERPCVRAFHAFDHSDILVATHAIPGTSADRSVIAMVALRSGEGANAAPVARTTCLEQLWSATAHLAERAALAIGVERSTRGRWISEREHQVLEQLVLGKSVREIAEEVGRSTHTIHDHVKSLHKKLGASSRGELVARALGFVAGRSGKCVGDGTEGRGPIMAGGQEEIARESETGACRATPLPLPEGAA